MAKQQTNTKPMALSLLFLFLLVTLPLSSSAGRFLIVAKNNHLQLLAGTLTGSGDSSGVVLSCDATAAVSGVQALRHCGRRGQMLLSMLPKGAVVPPSGPSRRTNGNNN